MTRRLVLLLALFAATFASAPAAAQLPIRAHLDWRTVRTQHFDVHYPQPLEAWALHVAQRLDAVHAAVARLVGSAPGARIDVIVEDPLNTSNGSAWPALDHPTIFLWPVPPEPTTDIGHHRGWGELLAVHEFAHLAHLNRPTRNPRQRLLWGLLPVPIGPLARRAPRWVVEGYATYVEGELSGSGRPYGVARAALLRQWALEGKLPTYAQMSASGAYRGGSFAYLVGSAYLEWLVAQHGDSSVVHLWRRLSARQNRSFADAFLGVFGRAPDDLYDRFTVEVTAQALAARDRLAAAGLAAGDTVQRLQWGTGAPAVSPDGRQVAVVLRSQTRPGRVVVWRTTQEPPDSAALEQRERRRRRDPEDVPAIEITPRPKKPLAVLAPVAGRAHEHPRFLPDGRHLLVTRLEPTGDGAYRPDLFLWNWQTKALRRLTRGAAIRAADPAPDGRSAVATRCLAGWCDVVRVDLRSGAVATLQTGSPTRSFYRPRYAPDGTWIVAALQEAGRWRLVRLDAATGALRYLDPDDGASRYDAAFLPGGAALVAVSERGGVADLERLDLASGAVHPLTRVTGAALAPAPCCLGPDTATVPEPRRRARADSVGRAVADTARPPRPDRSVFFLSLHAEGYDLSRIALDSAAQGFVALPSALWPAAPPAPVARDTFAVAALPPSRGYGIGPRAYRVLPGGSQSAEGGFATLALASSDPVGRLGWLAQGAYGDRGTWRGGSLRATWRGFRPELFGDLFYARHRPGERPGPAFARATLDADYAGALLGAALERSLGNRAQRLRLAASYGRLETPGAERDARQLAFADYGAALASTGEGLRVALQLGLYGAAGRTLGEGWRRGIATGGLSIGRGGSGLQLSGSYGESTTDRVPFEQFSLGGVQPPLFEAALLAQRVQMPALPAGLVAGPRLAVGRAALPLGPLTAYAWAGSVHEDLNDWHRVVGAEATTGVENMPLLRLPGLRFTIGAGYSLDEPLRERLRPYLGVVYRP